MNKTSIALILSLSAIAAIPSRAAADEVWTTDEYDVVYEEDRGRTAVWSYGNGLGTVFIDGLAGNTSDRGSYSGYWVQDSSSLQCDTFREGADGEPTYHWGQFEVTFLDAEFPSRWYANIGLCDQEPTIHLDGTPLLGGEPVAP